MIRVDSTIVKLYIDPTVVLVSTRIDDAVVERLDPEAASRASVGVDERSKYPALSCGR